MNHENDCEPVALEDTVAPGTKPSNTQHQRSQPLDGHLRTDAVLLTPSKNLEDAPKPIVLLLSRLRSTVLDVEHLLASSSDSVDATTAVIPYLAGDDTVRFLPAASATQPVDSSSTSATPGSNSAYASINILPMRRKLDAAKTILLELIKSNMLSELMTTITGDDADESIASGGAPAMTTISVQVDAVLTWLLCTQLITSPAAASLFDASNGEDTTAPSTAPSRFSQHRRHADPTRRTVSPTPAQQPSQQYKAFCASTDLRVLDVLESACRLIQKLVGLQEEATHSLTERIHAAPLDCDEQAMRAMLDAHDEESVARFHLLWVLFCSLRVALGCRDASHWELAPSLCCVNTTSTEAPAGDIDTTTRPLSEMLGGCSCFRSTAANGGSVPSKADAAQQRTRTSAVLAAVRDTGLLEFLLRRWDCLDGGRGGDRYDERNFKHEALLEFHQWLSGSMSMSLLEQLLSCLGRDMEHHYDEIGLLLEHIYSSHAALFQSPCGDANGTMEGPLPLMSYLADWISCTSGRHDEHTLASGQLSARFLTLCIVLFQERVHIPLALGKSIVRESLLRLADTAAVVKLEDELNDGHHVHQKRKATPLQRERWQVGRGSHAISGRSSARSAAAVHGSPVAKGERHGDNAHHSSPQRQTVSSSHVSPASAGIRCSSTSSQAVPQEATLLLALLSTRSDFWTSDMENTFSSKSLIANPLFSEWLGAAALILLPFSKQQKIVVETNTFIVTTVLQCPVTNVAATATIGVMDEVPPTSTTLQRPTTDDSSPLVGIPHLAHPTGRFFSISRHPPLGPSHQTCSGTQCFDSCGITVQHYVKFTFSDCMQRCAVVCEVRSSQLAARAASTGGVTILSRISGQAPHHISTEIRDNSTLPWSFGVSTIAPHSSSPFPYSSPSTAQRFSVSMGLCPDGPLVASRLHRRICELYFMAPQSSGGNASLSTDASVTVAMCAVHCAEVTAWMDVAMSNTNNSVWTSDVPPSSLLFSDDGAYAPLRLHQMLVSCSSLTALSSKPSTRSASPRGRSTRGVSPTTTSAAAADGLNAGPPILTSTAEKSDVGGPPSQALPPNNAALDQLSAELDASRQEVAELRALLTLKSQANEKLQLRLEASEEQRQGTTQRLSDLRLELELCQTSMVAPLRLETSKLRKQLQLKDQDLQLAMDALHTVALDNEVLSSHLHDVQQRLVKNLRL
ncbi:Hypothetical protein, putative [Bodo saltans]|uniref:Uncharacterized protein n=1 Tax=Bodo saltans TaxID=75058 RepID=A0A0S4J6E2_BODSA|nr:Hypothetical protein, putative [Bodo saltans]|eukprot:CUG67595.1 Hypothetical protein, putative [Bodo saltans]